jgi:antitoxin component YwqK of YwqJK toxin-antitoxin module
LNIKALNYRTPLKQVDFNFHEDSLKQIVNWKDTIVPFTNLDISLPYAEPFFNKMKSPVVVAEFSLANKTPALNVKKATEVKGILEAALIRNSGEHKYEYPNGKLKALLNLSNGKLNGECCWWNELGAIVKKGIFVDGEMP